MTKDVLTNKGVPAFEFSFLRSLFNLVSSMLLVKSYDQHYFASIPSSLYGTLGMRCLIGTVGFASFAIAMKFIPLSVFFIIFNSNPFTTALLGYFWIRERISAFEVAAMVCAFMGIVMMSMAAEKKPGQKSFDQSYNIGIAIAFVACFG